MIERIYNDKDCNECDKLLTLLIRDEAKYNEFIDNNFEVKDYFKNMVVNKNNILLGYKSNDLVVGYIFLKPIKDEERNGYLIDGLYVLNEYRNKGIAKKLISDALNEVKTTEFIDINVMYDNEIAKKIYKSFEFNEYRITMRR